MAFEVAGLVAASLHQVVLARHRLKLNHGEIGAALEVAYAGSKGTHLQRRYDINQNPNAVGKATRRWYTFQGPDRMTLRVDAAELTDPVVETLFIWERVAK